MSRKTSESERKRECSACGVLTSSRAVYKQHGENFFKDRHYLDSEFEELRPQAEASGAPPRTFAEVGCGAGNTVLPLLELHPRSTVHACDYSPRAVELTRGRAAAAGAAERLSAFVCDVTREPLVPHIPAESVDVLTLVFALSAMQPETMPAAVKHCVAALRRGSGVVCVRDYASGDLAEERLAGKGGQKLGDSFYARSDGTRAYYFTEKVLCGLFEAVGMVAKSCVVHEREIVNRAKELKMERRWIQAVFCWPEQAQQTAGLRDVPDVLAEPLEVVAEADGAVSAGGVLSILFSPAVDAASLSARAAPVRIDSAGRSLLLRLLGREWQHTERATGSMLWEGARALAAHLHSQPHLVAGARVLELGCGASALPSLAAAGAGSLEVVATDGHDAVLSLLRENIEANVGSESGPTLRSLRLRWGEEPLPADLWVGSGADAPLLVLGADVVYATELLPQLFRTAVALLRTAPGRGELLLCHVPDRGGANEDVLLRLAAEAGLAMEVAELSLAARELVQSLAMPPCRLLRGLLA